MDKLLSNRVKLLSVSVTIGISKKSKELTSKGLNVINLAIGESYFKTPKYIQNFTKFSIDLEKYFFYSPVPGYVDLRIAISKKIKRDNKLFYKYNHIIVSNGAKQAIANVFLSLINFGDDILIYLPCWPTYIDLVKLLGGNTIFIQGNIKKNFKVSIYQLYKSITKKTKIIIFSSPCNPTGSVLSKYEVIETSKVLKNSNIIIISDEIYEYVNFIGRNISISSILFMRNYAVIINGFSKGFSMTGWRVGYSISPLWLSKQCEKIQGQITSSISSISQRSAFSAIEKDISFILKMNNHLLKNKNISISLLKKIKGLHFNNPKGSFYLFINVSFYFGKSYENFLINNSNDFCIFILKKIYISLVPGTKFGDSNYVRFSYSIPLVLLRKAIFRMKTILSKLN